MGNFFNFFLAFSEYLTFIKLRWSIISRIFFPDKSTAPDIYWVIRCLRVTEVLWRAPVVHQFEKVLPHPTKALPSMTQSCKGKCSQLFLSFASLSLTFDICNNLETIIDMNQYIIEGFFKDEKGCLKISALALFHLTLSILSVCKYSTSLCLLSAKWMQAHSLQISDLSSGLLQAGAPVFDRTVNPIPTRGTDYAYHSNTSPPPRFSDLAKAIVWIFKFKIWK